MRSKPALILRCDHCDGWLVKVAKAGDATSISIRQAAIFYGAMASLNKSEGIKTPRFFDDLILSPRDVDSRRLIDQIPTGCKCRGGNSITYGQLNSLLQAMDAQGGGKTLKVSATLTANNYAINL